MEPDLDSLTSSILFAYIRSITPIINTRHTPFTDLYVPLTNLPAADINLRPEYLELLPHANLEASHLITLDDLPPFSKIATQLPPENTSWILVDHNSLQGTLGSIYSDRVHGVIDHHVDEHKVPEDTAPEPRIIEKSGSCTSLVTEYCQEAWDQVSSSAYSTGAANAQADAIVDDAAVVKTWDAQAAKLALASILIDTHNLKDESKVTPHDTNAVKYLEAKISLAPQKGPVFDRQKFFQDINSAKSRIDRLSVYDILRKDYKEWTEKDEKKIGISSVVKPVKFLVEKSQKEDSDAERNAFLDIVRKYAEDRGLGICAIMTAFEEHGGFHRELFVWALDPECVDSLKKFSAAAVEELKVEEHEASSSLDDTGSSETWRKVWVQKDLSKSRKQVAPLLREKLN